MLTDQTLAVAGLDTGITEDECNLIDAIYLPSKYPIAAVTPALDVGADVGTQGHYIAEHVTDAAKQQLG